jgi:hypothetical protein
VREKAAFSCNTDHRTGAEDDAIIQRSRSKTSPRREDMKSVEVLDIDKSNLIRFEVKDTPVEDTKFTYWSQ